MIFRVAAATAALPASRPVVVAVSRMASRGLPRLGTIWSAGI